MTRAFALPFIALFALCFALLASAQDEPPVVAYFQSSDFNAPLLPGWEDQSGEDYAQFQLPEASASIRVAMSSVADANAAARSDLKTSFGIQLPEPIYSGKVNLADGTWTVLAYRVDEITSASVMTRRADSRSIIISLVERDPAVEILALAIARADDASQDASPEMQHATQALSLPAPDLDSAATLNLPSGDWLIASGDATPVMGLVFGNDSYVVLANGATDLLPQIADAWNRTLLGFFITPDNSTYLALALTSVFAVLALLILSFFWRWRNIAKDQQLIESLADEGGTS